MTYEKSFVGRFLLGQPRKAFPTSRRSQNVSRDPRGACNTELLPLTLVNVYVKKMKMIKPDQDLDKGLIGLHVLHHAVKKAVFGLWFLEELSRHGYKISPGTLYPLLHRLERKGYLRSSEERNGKQRRRLYRATPLGRKILAIGKKQIRELFIELFEE